MHNQSTFIFRRGAALAPRALFIAFLMVALTACDKKPAGPLKAPPPEVVTIAVTSRPVVLTTDLPGRTSAYRVAEVRPQVSGLIQKRLFTEGSEVQAGQPLYQIDPAPFEAALANAKAALARAEANVPAARARAERYKQAIEQKAVSQQTYDDAAAALQLALADVEFYKATVRTAGINLEYARVVSPITGRIGASTVTDGAIVTGYQPVALATVQQLDPIYVDVPQSATDLLRLQEKLAKGQISRGGTNVNQVELYLPDGSKYPHAGTLQFTDVSVDPGMGTVTLRMVFPNPDKVLLPGMFVRARVMEGASENAILVPQQTVSRDPKGNPQALLVGEDSKVQIRKLVLDRELGTEWIVTSGLKPGERIIMEGSQKARPGMPVKEVPYEQTTNAAAAAAPSGQPQAPAPGAAPEPPQKPNSPNTAGA